MLAMERRSSGGVYEPYGSAVGARVEIWRAKDAAINSDGMERLRRLLAKVASERSLEQKRMARHAAGFLQTLPERPDELLRASESDPEIAEAMRLGAQGLRFLGLAGGRGAQVCADAIERMGRPSASVHGDPEDGSWSFECSSFDPPLIWELAVLSEDSAGFSLREAKLGSAGMDLAFALVEFEPLDPKGDRLASWRLVAKSPVDSMLDEGEAGRAVADLVQGLDEWLDGRLGWVLPESAGSASSLVEMIIEGAPVMRLRGFKCLCLGRDLGGDGLAAEAGLRKWLAGSSHSQARAARRACEAWGLELAGRVLEEAPSSVESWI